jgi:hypothetical protein
VQEMALPVADLEFWKATSMPLHDLGAANAARAIRDALPTGPELET